jgi:hypothetical protein
MTPKQQSYLVQEIGDVSFVTFSFCRLSSSPSTSSCLEHALVLILVLVLVLPWIYPVALLASRNHDAH